MKAARWALLALALLAGPLEAQGVGPGIKYGKWLALAGAAGLGYLAGRSHGRAEDAFHALEARCGPDARASCDLGPDGRYLDPASEDLYQTSLREDRYARRWLLGGEVALVGTAALFVYELTRPRGRPPNIPFEPEVRSLRRGTGVGLRLEF